MFHLFVKYIIVQYFNILRNISQIFVVCCRGKKILHIIPHNFLVIILVLGRRFNINTTLFSKHHVLAGMFKIKENFVCFFCNFEHTKVILTKNIDLKLEITLYQDRGSQVTQDSFYILYFH